MNRFDNNFINRCNEFSKPYIEELLEKKRRQRYKWNEKNPGKLKECQKRYLMSEKGIEARKRRSLKRYTWIKTCLEYLTEEEKVRIKKIYLQRKKYPGYEVDHIIPICEGGAHHPNNLRIIPRRENIMKGRKIV